MHIGTFTPGGTFLNAIEKLDHLVRMGVTAIEIMPIADFPGRRNWGYDGVLLYAPDGSYGRPEDLKTLVEAAHHRSLMVILDVVYNHFGPDGNYLPVYAPEFFTDRHKTPWGPALNFDGPGNEAVREFIIHNALYWVEQFHLDGLRLDAVHAICDDSPKHVLAELAERVHRAAVDRPVHLILENEENQVRWLERNGVMRPRWYTAQWNDDLHHVLHTAVSGEASGYYAAYRGEPLKLGRALAEGFAFQGEVMAYRGRRRGEPSRHLPPTAFVAFLQNHDQIGNRALGDRLAASVPRPALRAAAAIYLLSPQVPMLFMGEEWSALEPFPFFCDFGPELAQAVRDGRRQEFAKFPEFRDAVRRERIPDPQADETFASAKLRWVELVAPEHRESLEWYQRILAIRREAVLPLLRDIRSAGDFAVVSNGAVSVRWQVGTSAELRLDANLAAVPASGFPSAGSRLLWQEGAVDGADGTFQPWTVVWSCEGHAG
jgi:malto-oligosyltrehalose trehalohydrolase